MLTSILALVLTLLAPFQDAPGPQKPAVRPLTIDDALVVLPGVRGRVVSMGDLDGDGAPEIATSGSVRGHPTIDVYSARDGKPFRRLWQGSNELLEGETLVWDAGGDIDADGVADLLIGLPRGSTRAERTGAVLVISGASGEVLQQSTGEAAFDGYGSSVAFVGDLDGDDHDDYCVGSTRADTDLAVIPIEEVAAYESSGQHPFIRFRDGSRTDLEQVYQEGLSARSDRPGRVVACSGRDGQPFWSVSAGPAGHAFGARVQSVGDLDGDGVDDVLVQCDRRSTAKVVVLSGASGGFLARLDHDHGPTGSAGDLDGDGVPDLFFDSQEIDSTTRGSTVRIVSGATFKDLCRIAYPDLWGDCGVTVGVGDLDGDGVDDLAVGEPNYNLPGPGEQRPGYQPPELEKLTLAEAVALPSSPESMSCESGCLLVVSGRTRAPIWGVFGHPGSREGIGFHVTAIPDVTGDGLSDLVVAGADGTYVFAGPGKSGQ